jgi:hypothetical protein
MLKVQPIPVGEDTPMSTADWRSADAYQELRSLDAPAFAFEFLRRNPEFRADHARLARKARGRPLEVSDADAFAERWGVRFRRRIAGASSKRRSMDGQGTSQSCHANKSGGRPRQS